MSIPGRTQGQARQRAKRSFAQRELLLPAQHFVHTGTVSAGVLLLAALAALAWANSPWSASYHHFWEETYLGFDLGFLEVRENLRHWVNDGLMVIFFFVVGLEVRHELDCGELSSLRRSGLPVIAAALGGMVLPAATYAAFNWGGENLAGRVGSLSAGWALACRNPLFRPVLRAGLAQIGGWNVEEVRRTIQPVGDAYVEDAASPAGRGRHCPHPLILVWMAVFCCAVALSADAVPEREVSGVRMPEVVSVAGRELHLNGIGLRKSHIFFKVYVAGLYLEKPTTDARTAITTDEAKRIVLVMLRDVGRKKFVQSVEEGILRNSGPAMPALRTRLDRLEMALPDLKKGNVLDFTYLPGAGTLVRGQGREMTIPGKDFADALFSVWLGPKPTSEDLKRQLLSGPPSAPATDSIGHMRMPAPRGAIPRKGSPLGSAERASRGLARARSSASFVPPRWERGRADSDLRARLRCRLRCRDPGDSGGRASPRGESKKGGLFAI